MVETVMMIHWISRYRGYFSYIIYVYPYTLHAGIYHVHTGR